MQVLSPENYSVLANKISYICISFFKLSNFSSKSALLSHFGCYARIDHRSCIQPPRRSYIAVLSCTGIGIVLATILIHRYFLKVASMVGSYPKHDPGQEAFVFLFCLLTYFDLFFFTLLKKSHFRTSTRRRSTWRWLLRAGSPSGSTTLSFSSLLESRLPLSSSEVCLRFSFPSHATGLWHCISYYWITDNWRWL